ncbi:MAG TPA: VWA domain-containing protein, partial [Phycisphaerales bacterium]|nr:VWA domain-containing protein [Phycisphaerales bacterium]
GRHSGAITGDGVVEIEKTKPYEFGDSATNVDVVGSVLNASARHAQREGNEPWRASLDDLQIHLTRNNPKCATMVLMDMSGSMRYDGQYIHCKRMALALDGLIRTEYPGDYVGFVEMYSLAKVRHISEVPSLLPKPVSIHAPRVRLKADMSNPRMSEMQLPQHFTNIQHALQLSRQVLSGQDTPNRQIMLITDGLPTAHFEGKDLYFLYPPDPLTEQATMREAMLCKRAGITINIFLLPSWSQSSEDIQFAHRLAETTQGRVFFTGGRDLDRYVVWDYVKQRRRVIG